MIANEDGSLSSNTEMLPYACFGVVLAGLLYVVLAALFKVFGTKAVMRYFPPIVTGPIIICIGLTLSSTAITNCPLQLGHCPGGPSPLWWCATSGARVW